MHVASVVYRDASLDDSAKDSRDHSFLVAHVDRVDKDDAASGRKLVGDAFCVQGVAGQLSFFGRNDERDTGWREFEEVETNARVRDRFHDLDAAFRNRRFQVQNMHLSQASPDFDSADAALLFEIGLGDLAF